jgi:hypothetical protein
MVLTFYEILKNAKANVDAKYKSKTYLLRLFSYFEPYGRIYVTSKFPESGSKIRTFLHIDRDTRNPQNLILISNLEKVARDIPVTVIVPDEED